MKCPRCGTELTSQFNPWTGKVYEESGEPHSLRRCVEAIEAKQETETRAKTEKEVRGWQR